MTIQVLSDRVAIENVCAWPNLKLLNDNTIIATIFNQPCHGEWEGDLDCYASEDGGESWNFRARVAAHDAGTNRKDHAAGFARNGDLIVLVAGSSGRFAPGNPTDHSSEQVLPARVCRSNDDGFNWQVIGELPAFHEKILHPLVPFGDVQISDDGSLCATAYAQTQDADKARRYSYLLRSNDDGLTWNEYSVVGAGNEAALLHLGNGKWFAGSRAGNDVAVNLFRSDDDARTWKFEKALTQPLQVPGHFLRLRDGRILFSYGNRRENEFGVEALISCDDGQSWSPPIRIAKMKDWDGGYPSSVERDDGIIVTAYYHRRAPYDYAMSAVLWQIDAR